MRRLQEPRAPLANFFASGVLRLREKLGPILWQFPATMRFDKERFRAFFELLPRDTHAFARLAEQHDGRLKGAAAIEPDARRLVRLAVECRHESFLANRFVALLREYNIALVAADLAGKFPTAHDVTAEFAYLRLHGSRTLYTSGYGPKELDTWSTRVKAWARSSEPAGAKRIGPKTVKQPGGRDVFVYFDNTDVKLRAPVDVRGMARRLGLGPRDTATQVLAEPGVKRKEKKEIMKQKTKKKKKP